MMQMIQIDLLPFEQKFRGEVSSDLKTLLLIDEAVKSEDTVNKEYILRLGYIHSEVPNPPIDYLKAREIDKCFKSIMGSLQNYMDVLIAAIRLKESEDVWSDESNMAEIEKVIQPKFQKHLMDVSTDKKLTVPTKLDLLFTKPESKQIRDAVQSYFDIRNGLEHHKGIAKVERELVYKRIVMITSEGDEYNPLSVPKPGVGILMKTVDERISYSKGGELMIARSILDAVVLNLLMFVVPLMRVEVEQKIK